MSIKRLHVYLIVFVGLMLCAASLLYHYVGISDHKVVTARDLTQFSFEELSAYFEDLANSDGARVAYEELRSAVLPEHTDLHLLGHVIGDALYLQEGVEGIAVCTDDFRNACSHSIVIGTLLEHGEGAMPLIHDACTRAPGGQGAYTMCFHGLGHGVLAYHGYDLEDAVSFCRGLGTDAYGGREYDECVGGAIMELISGGGHDRELWEEKREQYFSAQSPLALCGYPFMTRDIQSMCYTYITPYLFEFAGGDLGDLKEEDYRMSFLYCDALPQSDTESREACFGGFGKEFVVLVEGRDIRSLESLATAQLKTVHRWCGLAPTNDGQAACVRSAVRSLFWGGENDPRVAIRFCDAAHADVGRECYDALYHDAALYITEGAVRTALCDMVTETERTTCRRTILDLAG